LRRVCGRQAFHLISLPICRSLSRPPSESIDFTMVSLSPDQWRALAAQRLLGLLDTEGAVTKPEMEAKLSEAAVGVRSVAGA